MSSIAGIWMSENSNATNRSLVQIPLQLMQDLSEGNLAGAQQQSQYKLSPYLISDECRGTWRRRFLQICQDPSLAAWITRLLICSSTGLVLGRAGFHGPPDAYGTVEIGHAIDPSYRRKGHARAALEIMLHIARTHPLIKTIRATIRPDNLPSRALIDQYSFKEVGEQWDDEDGLEIILELCVS